MRIAHIDPQRMSFAQHNEVLNALREAARKHCELGEGEEDATARCGELTVVREVHGHTERLTVRGAGGTILDVSWRADKSGEAINLRELRRLDLLEALLF